MSLSLLLIGGLGLWDLVLAYKYLASKLVLNHRELCCPFIALWHVVPLS
jgi:hypothetical protein